MDIPFFAWPFLLGIIFIIVFFIIISIIWITGLSVIDRVRIRRNIFTVKTLQATWEVFRESLIHKKMYKKNLVLGYMHMSFAFGWFLLIIAGHLEAAVHYHTLNFPFWKSIFFRYAETNPPVTFIAKAFSATTDLLLIYIFSGIFLALYKRFNSKPFGMKKTTHLKAGDKIALIGLWLIFPSRYVCESITAGIYQNGSFFTQPTGNFLASFLPLQSIELASWWVYSLSLAVFFFALPVSRYMHIPVEILLIFVRKYGVQLKKHVNGYTRIQTFACSRCGVCLDSCQMIKANINNSQSVYFLKQIRGRKLNDEQLFNCLLCGRCQKDCPVGLDLNDLRITQRIESTKSYNSKYSYLSGGESPKADVVYFTGCMTHLTPSIKKATLNILDYAHINYWFMDKDEAPCCGRPLMQAGQYEAAKKLIRNNTEKILASGAKILLVSCPICYQIFNEDYELPGVKVMHHSEYFLELINKGLIPTIKLPVNAVYHDPCTLGRGSHIYEPPRELLKNYLSLIPMKQEKEDALCCGGSLGNIKIEMDERKQIRDDVLETFQSYNPDQIITACPLCKKTFAMGTDIEVHDLAEIVWKGISRKEHLDKKSREVKLIKINSLKKRIVPKGELLKI